MEACEGQVSTIEKDDKKKEREREKKKGEKEAAMKLLSWLRFVAERL